jgi:hypothetical protein
MPRVELDTPLVMPRLLRFFFLFMWQAPASQNSFSLSSSPSQQQQHKSEIMKCNGLQKCIEAKQRLLCLYYVNTILKRKELFTSYSLTALKNMLFSD